MECNKEEAIRAKVIAEKKMESKDFSGARKIALKAQLLHPELENILQVICVCDVHCSAENKNMGNEKDWYGILQVEQTADDGQIKKQYRKLALLLHPDKNKFPGAEAAFKLIGEAQRVLLDREKRSFYDCRYRRFTPNLVPNNPYQPSRNVNFARQPWGHNHMNNAGPNVNWQPNPQAYSKPSDGWETFIASCPFCAFQFRQYKDGPYKVLQCQQCKRSIAGYDLYSQWTGSNSNQTATYTRVDISNQGVNRSASNGIYQGNPGPQMPGGNSFTNFGQSKNIGRSKKVNESNMNASKINKGSYAGSKPERKDIRRRGKKRAVECSDSSESDSSSDSESNMNASKINRGSYAGSKPERKDIGRRGKKRAVESSDSFESDSSSDSEDAEVENKPSSLESDINRRRSSRSKRHVSYNENNESDDEIFNSDAPLKTESTDFTKPPRFAEETGKDEIDEANGNDPVAEDDVQSEKAENGTVPDPDSSSPEAQILEVPDPEFSNFDDLRKEDRFKAGQIWAVYDTIDAMPRYYALIKKVFPYPFKLRITWLEADPDEEFAALWASKDLPCSCGKFIFGITDNTQDLNMFSHLTYLEKKRRGKDIEVYPMKNETWALFRNWNRDWINNDVTEYEYDFVEVLSDYDESLGIQVVPLSKMKGFACLFCREGGNAKLIPPSELLKFSHRVPSFRLTGKEREDVPPGSFELDPASVPISLLNK